VRTTRRPEGHRIPIGVGVREGVGTFSEVIMFRRALGRIRRRSGAFVAPFFALGGGAMATNTHIGSPDAIPSEDLAGSSYGSPVIASASVTTGAWRLSLRALAITAIVVAASAIEATGASAAGPVQFVCTSAEQTYSVPPGVTALKVKAVGAPGAPAGNSKAGSGGLGALVSATVPLPPGTNTVYVEVGCAGSVGAGGFNDDGGGSTGDGGGGGGASDVRLDPRSTGLTPTDSRLVVAGGGGGGGTCSDPGGTAGDGSVTGAGQGDLGDDGECGVFGLGILPGSRLNGGFGGTAGGTGGSGTVLNPCAGAPGSLGQGGPGCNKGGGGGGGYWGGGGGGDANLAGGGGGAGSSFWVPDARSTSMHFSKKNLPPEVVISPAH
jgi:hypothetical protein